MPFQSIPETSYTNRQPATVIAHDGDFAVQVGGQKSRTSLTVVGDFRLRKLVGGNYSVHEYGQPLTVHVSPDATVRGAVFDVDVTGMTVAQVFRAIDATVRARRLLTGN